MRQAPHPSGEILVAAGRFPGTGRLKDDKSVRRFLASLARDWNVHLCAAGPSREEARGLGNPASGGSITLVGRERDVFLASLKQATSARRYQALLMLDDPLIRSALDPVALHSRLPVVLVMIDPNGTNAFRHSRDMEPPRRPAWCSPAELWCFGDAPPALDTAGLFPGRFRLNGDIDGPWMSRRLRGLLSGARAAPVPGKLVSVIIPCWNNLEYTRRCVESVRRWADVPYELILVDNGSTDGTGAFAASPRAGGAAGRSAGLERAVHVLRNETNLGFAKAVNQGMRKASGDYILWLNNDAMLTPSCLGRMISCLERAPWIGAVGPCTNETVGEQYVANLAGQNPQNLPFMAQAWAMAHYGQAKLIHRLTGFCFLLKRRAMLQTGLLDERFEIGCYEDFDYCLRLRQAGYEIALAQDVFVHHCGHKTFGGRDHLLERAALNREIFVDKWCRRGMEFLDDLDPLLAQRARLQGSAPLPGPAAENGGARHAPPRPPRKTASRR